MLGTYANGVGFQLVVLRAPQSGALFISPLVHVTDNEIREWSACKESLGSGTALAPEQVDKSLIVRHQMVVFVQSHIAHRTKLHHLIDTLKCHLLLLQTEVIIPKDCHENAQKAQEASDCHTRLQRAEERRGGEGCRNPGW